MQEPLRHSTVVRDEQQSLRIGIKAPYGVKACRSVRQEVEHGLASAVIACRGEIADRLIEQEIDAFRFFLHRNPVHGNFMQRGVIFTPELRHAHAVYSHAPCANHLLGAASRSDPRIGEYFLQTLFHHSPLSNPH